MISPQSKRPRQEAEEFRDLLMFALPCTWWCILSERGKKRKFSRAVCSGSWVCTHGSVIKMSSWIWLEDKGWQLASSVRAQNACVFFFQSRSQDKLLNGTSKQQLQKSKAIPGLPCCFCFVLFVYSWCWVERQKKWEMKRNYNCWLTTTCPLAVLLVSMKEHCAPVTLGS